MNRENNVTLEPNTGLDRQRHVRSPVASGRGTRGKPDDRCLGLFNKGFNSAQHFLMFFALLKGHHVILALV